jgi:hypothetical protein
MPEIGMPRRADDLFPQAFGEAASFLVDARCLWAVSPHERPL